jgi:cyclophilin family peptidyl-prolyl cis-trans isomerase
MTLDGMATGVPVDITITMHDDWSPIGAAHFKDLVNAGFYDGARFFRVLGGFIAQVGLNSQNDGLLVGDMADTLQDDPNVGQTNAKCTLTYATAGPNTRDHQIFFNYAENAFLDDQGFTPFGVIAQPGCDEAIAGIAEVGEVISQGDLTADSKGAIDAFEASSEPAVTVSYIATATVNEDVVVSEDNTVAELAQKSATVSNVKTSVGNMVVVGGALGMVALATALIAVRKMRSHSPIDNSEAPCVPTSSSLDDFPSTII